MSAGQQTETTEKPAPSLTRSAASGVKWNAVSQAGQQLMQLVTMIVLARLLSPGDFGLLGMALIVAGFLAIFKDMGTSSALIRDRDNEPELLATIFWTNTGLGVLAFLLLVAISPLLAIFFHESRLSPVLCVMAAGFFLSGLSNVHKALLERHLAFRALAAAELSGVLAGAVVGIGLARAGAGVWALVAQALANITVNTLLLWVLSSYRPQFRFSWERLRQVAGFSLNLTGYNVFNYAVRNTDNLLIGRFLGAAPLGIYALAYRIMVYPLQSVTTVISRVMYPVYAQIQDDDPRMRSAFARTTGMIALVTFPMMMGVCALARPFMLTVFGPQWAEAIPLVRLLAPIGMAQSIVASVGVIFQTKGRTDLLFRWGLLSGTLFIASFAIGLHWGVLGVATGYVIVSSTLMIPNLMLAQRLIHMRLLEFCIPIAGPLAASLLMAAVLVASGGLFHTLPQGAAFALQVVSGGVFYVAISLAINRRQMQDAWQLILHKG